MKYDFPMIVAVAFERIVLYFRRIFACVKTYWLCWLWGIVHIGKVRFEGKTVIRTRRYGEIVLGQNVIFNSYFCSNLVGLLNPTVLDTRFGGHIEIGDGTGASSVVISSMKSVKIGVRCKIGGNVRIFDHDFHSIDPKIRATLDDRNNIRSRNVEIGDDCFIGTNSIILKGVKIGDRSIVAAGSVVCGLEVPPDSLVRGNPAIVVSRNCV